MFGLEILDVALGIVVVYFLFSLLAAAIVEGVEAVVKSRAVYLERGIRELLDDREGTGLAQLLYQHPLISSLYRGQYQAEGKRVSGGLLPTYIPSKQFAAALIDLAVRGPVSGTPAAHYDAEHTQPVFDAEVLRSSIRYVPSPLVRRALHSAIDQSRGDLERVQANLEAWFDGTMDRVSGWYKRRTQLWLFAIGLSTSVIMNVNTITIAEYLAHNDEARSAMVKRAEGIVSAGQPATSEQPPTAQAAVENARAQMATLRKEFAAIGLPIGWDRAPEEPDDPTEWYGWLTRHIAGLLLTAFAVTLGAPFWFDVLNKIMVIRSTVKPREKSQEEGSEDRPLTRAPAAPPSQTAAGTPAAGPPPPAAPPPPGPPPVTVTASFTRHEWASGDADEGIL